MDPESIYMLLRRSHIFVGLGGLIAFWIPIFAKKGGRVHGGAGRVFEWCGYYVVATALFACGRYLLTPHHFAFIDRPDVTPEELARVQSAQFFLTLLAFLAILFLVQLRTGMRVVRTRKQTAEEYRNLEARFWLYFQPFACVLLISYGAYRLATGGSAAHWISVVVGAIPMLELKKELHFFRNPRGESTSWFFKHMDCMLGCGVAFHTAGFVFSSRWLAANAGLELPGAWQIVPWVIPAAIGVPLSSWYVRKYRKRMVGRSETPVVAADAARST